MKSTVTKYAFGVMLLCATTSNAMDNKKVTPEDLPSAVKMLESNMAEITDEVVEMLNSNKPVTLENKIAEQKKTTELITKSESLKKQAEELLAHYPDDVGLNNYFTVQSLAIDCLYGSMQALGKHIVNLKESQNF